MTWNSLPGKSTVIFPRILFFFGWFIFAFTPDRANAQPAPERAYPDAVSPDSPRASLTDFLELSRAGRFDEASEYLDASETPLGGRGPKLARRLKAVLDHYLWFDLQKISDHPDGDTGDGLAPLTDQIGKVPGESSPAEPVRMARKPGANQWRFTANTVARIDSWYEGVPNGWLLDILPAPLFRPGPRDVLWWQWLALPILLLLAWLAGSLLSLVSRKILGHFAARTQTRWDDAILERVQGPLAVVWTLAALYFMLPGLALYKPAEEFIHVLMRAVFLLVLFWTGLRTVDIGAQIVLRSPWAGGRSASRSLIPLGSRMAKVVLIAFAVVALLSEFGYPVASLVASLGIGGLALALAAQKTVENLFGAFSIGADQPFREGDFIRVEDLLGTVEAIGLRSTKIRTLDRTLVSVPNGKLADMRLESYSERDRFRLACTVGLVYGTTTQQVNDVLAGLEKALRAHPKIWTEAVVVRFAALGAFSLDIEVMAWFEVADYAEFQFVRQEILLSFMDVVEGAGTSFAFPTQTVHLVGGT